MRECDLEQTKTNKERERERENMKIHLKKCLLFCEQYIYGRLG